MLISFVYLFAVLPEDSKHTSCNSCMPKMLRKSLIVVVLAVYLVSTATSQRDSDSDVGHGDDSFEDGDRNPILSDDDDMQEGHETDSTPRRLGPFNTSLESGAISLRLFWTVLTEDKNSNEPTEIEFTLLTNASKIKWLAFGFTENKRFNEADWFVAWKSHRGRLIYTKDCNSMKGVLHYDLQQDYDVISPGRLHSFNLRVRRALDTGDVFDVVLEKGMSTTLVWAYGMARTFSRIKHEITRSWKSKEIILFGDKEQGTPENMGKTGEIAENRMENPKGKAAVEETRNNGKEEIEKKSSPTPKHRLTGTAFDGVVEPSRTNHKSESRKLKTQDGAEQYTKGADKVQTESALSYNKSTDRTTRPCTVVVKYTKRWRDYFKLKERSVYYAILGSSAIMTGMLVLILVCCCRKRASDPRKSKVSFYKVDDYDDEQIEFLKDKA